MAWETFIILDAKYLTCLLHHLFPVSFYSNICPALIILPNISQYYIAFYIKFLFDCYLTNTYIYLSFQWPPWLTFTHKFLHIWLMSKLPPHKVYTYQHLIFSLIPLLRYLFGLFYSLFFTIQAITVYFRLFGSSRYLQKLLVLIYLYNL